MFDNDYDYTSLDHNGKLYKKALEIDGKYGSQKNDKIDGNEKSIFFKWAKKYAKEGDTEAKSLFGDSNSVFGVAYSEDVRYTPRSSSSGSSSGTATPEISDDNSSSGNEVSVGDYDITKLSNDERKSLVADGEDYGEKLYKYLNGTNVAATFGGFDFWGVFGDDDHEKASDLITSLDDATPLEIAALVQKFNAKSKADSQEKICKFMVNEVWSKEEDAVQLIAEKTIDMCNQLTNKGKWTYNPAVDKGYQYLKNIQETPKIVDNEYDDNELIMDKIDSFVAKISELYLKEFGPTQ